MSDLIGLEGVAFTDTGSGSPTVVFLHGGFSDHSDWTSQIEALRGRYRCVAVDLPGHGRSGGGPGAISEVGRVADRIESLVGHLGVTNAVLVGHSFSCRVVIELQRRPSAEFRGLVLVDGSCVGVDDARGETQPFLGGDTDAAARIKRTFEAMFFPGHDPQLRARILERLNHFSPRAVDALQSAALMWDATEAISALRAVSVPLLAVQSTCLSPTGARVQLTDREGCPWLELLGGLVPNHAIAILPGVGHFSMLEAPQLVSDAIGTFLRSLSRRGTQ